MYSATYIVFAIHVHVIFNIQRLYSTFRHAYSSLRLLFPTLALISQFPFLFSNTRLEHSHIIIVIQCADFTFQIRLSLLLTFRFDYSQYRSFYSQLEFVFSTLILEILNSDLNIHHIVFSIQQLDVLTQHLELIIQSSDCLFTICFFVILELDVYIQTLYAFVELLKVFFY